MPRHMAEVNNDNIDSLFDGNDLLGSGDVFDLTAGDDSMADTGISLATLQEATKSAMKASEKERMARNAAANASNPKKRKKNKKKTKTARDAEREMLAMQAANDIKNGIIDDGPQEQTVADDAPMAMGAGKAMTDAYDVGDQTQDADAVSNDDDTAQEGDKATVPDADGTQTGDNVQTAEQGKKRKGKAKKSKDADGQTNDMATKHNGAKAQVADDGDSATGGTGHTDADEADVDDDLTTAEDGEETDDGTSTDAAGQQYESLAIPDWASAIASKREASVSHAFMLSGNIRDYMMRKVSIRDGIIGMLDANQTVFEMIATYNQADGLQFDLGDGYTNVTPDEYRKRFVRAMHAVRKQQGDDDPTDDTIPRDPCALFSIISGIFDMDVKRNGKPKMLLFVDHADMLVPEGPSLQLRESDKRLAIIMSDMCRSYKAEAGGSCVVFFTDALGQVNSMLRDSASRVDLVNVPLPDLEERRDFIDHVLDVRQNVLSDGRQVFECQDDGGVNAYYLAINTAGLARYQIEDIVLRAIADDVPITAQSIKDRKNEIIKNDYNDVIEIMDPTFGFEGLGGMELVKKFFKEEVIDPVHAGALEAVPMGILMEGPAGTGKCLPRLTLLPTPNGMVQAGNIHIGDQLFDIHGKPTTVIGVYPQGKQTIYNITLRDGRTVQCSGNHLWSIYKASSTKLTTLQTESMKNNGIKYKSGSYKYYMPYADCVEYEPKQYRIHPYVIGCLLGDGNLSFGSAKHYAMSISMAPSDREIVDRIAMLIESPEVVLKKSNGFIWSFRMSEKQKQEYMMRRKQQGGIITNNVKNIQADDFLRGYEDTLLCKCNEKSIPEEYKYGSVEQRLELIRGMMDTDGSISERSNLGEHRTRKQYRTVYTTTSKRLCDDFREVLFSLGIPSYYNVQINRDIPYTNGKSDKIYYANNKTYRITINCTDEIKQQLFHLKRKKDIAIQAAEMAYNSTTRHWSHKSTAIVNIEKTNQQTDMICFMVDNPEHLFLVTRNYIPSHNTVMAKAVAKEANMNCVALNMNNIFDKYVGQSERNLDRALDCALSMAPTIVFIDEIDEALPKRHQGEISGVSNRVNKTMLTFLSDTSHRGQVIVIGASNYGNMIDAAMKRAGRFDKRIPIFAPTGYDRVRIIKISARKATSVNVNGDTEPYQFSCLRDPDKLMANPFRGLERWLQDGHTPQNQRFLGDQVDYTYVAPNDYGSQVEHTRPLSKAVFDVIGKPRITIQQFYRAFSTLMDIPDRISSESFETETNSSYYSRVNNLLWSDMYVGIFVGDVDTEQDVTNTINSVMSRFKYYDKVYKRFMDTTDHMTGAELDVVVQKAITLFRKWIQADGGKAQTEAIATGRLKGKKDIPWGVLKEACLKTTSSMASVKSMEDNALLDTSDLDFVPDAIYGLRNGVPITYKQRLEELRLNADNVQ